ncbi:MAG: EscS/YscS/HrcS family type III secretion system export apparatus protein [Gammaproteobacteria bacterium]|nr:EscS/YscS/HrcS family type III secretion system export apparatus protein [Gammaproteobacteria bacterium]
METSSIIDMAAHALLLVLYLSMPPIIAAAGVGTLVALLQALTQVQEQTLSFAIKLFVVVIVIFATARWLGQELFHFAVGIFDMIPSI